LILSGFMPEEPFMSATYSELLKGNRNFRRLWTGQVISELGTWFSFIAELGLVRMFSGSALATTALLVARLLPYFLVAPFAGVLVDRLSRKRIMIAADLLRALVALGYLAAAASGSVAAVCVCSATMSSLAMFFEAAKNAAMPNLVAPRELLTANIMMYSTRFLQLTLGSALGGVTAARFGYDIAFVVDSATFIVSAIAIALVPASAMKQRARAQSALTVAVSFASNTAVESGVAIPADGSGKSDSPVLESEQASEQTPVKFFSDLREGFRYIWSTSFVRAVILVNIGWAMGGGMNAVLFDQIGGHSFAHADDRGDWNVAALFTAAGVGLFIGMLLARRIGGWVAQERRATHYIGWSLIAHGLFFAMAGLMSSLALVALCVAVSRLIIAAEFGVQETLLMRVIPDQYRGRVFTTDRSLEIGMMTISMVVAGWLLNWVSPMTMLIVSGLLSATPGVVWLIVAGFGRFTVPARAVRESYGD
jgi:MFS family permease